MKIRTLLAAFGFTTAILAAQSGMEVYQRAVSQERAGKLEQAIKLYEQVAHDFGSDRALAAKALVAAAKDYEKLGEDKAVKLYEHVVREYGDQREFAATANARLTALRQSAPVPPPTMTQRKIELPVAPTALVATSALIEGQRIIYHDPASGAIMISDLAGTDKRVIFKGSPDPDTPTIPSPSPDFSSVLLATVADKRPFPLAVIKPDGTGYREIGRLEDARDLDEPRWSWDNRYVVIAYNRSDGSGHLVTIAVADGQSRELLRFGDHPIREAAFSPDGRFIAFSEGQDANRISILASQGGEPQLISENASLLDWTRDGRYLMVASPHSGVMALQLLPVKDGKLAGTPVVVRDGSFRSGRMTSNGALLYTSYPTAGRYRTWIADLDADGRPGEWKSLDLSPSTSLWPFPSWSPDSGQIAWTVRNDGISPGSNVIRVRNIATGKERDIYRGTKSLTCNWAARHNNLFCSEVAGDERTTAVLSITVDSDAPRVERLGSVPGAAAVSPGPDDQTLYIGQLKGTAEQKGLWRWDLATHQQKLLDPAWVSSLDYVRPSPDGAWLMRRANGNLEVRPLSGGDWNPLLPMPTQSQFGFWPDGKWVLYHGLDADGKDGLYRIATTGGAPQRLGDFPTNKMRGRLTVSPNGRKIIAQDGDTSVAYEVWLLENFEPK